MVPFAGVARLIFSFQARKLMMPVARGLGDRLGGVVADRGDRGRLGVEALRVGADDRELEAAGAALVDRAVAVDERVVADVVPAVRVDMEAADPEDDARRLLRRVVVRVDGVVDDGGADGRRTRPARAAGSRRPARSAPQLARGTTSGLLGDGLGDRGRGDRDQGRVDARARVVQQAVGEAAGGAR